MYRKSLPEGQTWVWYPLDDWMGFRKLARLDSQADADRMVRYAQRMGLAPKESEGTWSSRRGLLNKGALKIHEGTCKVYNCNDDGRETLHEATGSLWIYNHDGSYWLLEHRA